MMKNQVNISIKTALNYLSRIEFLYNYIWFNRKIEYLLFLSRLYNYIKTSSIQLQNFL